MENEKNTSNFKIIPSVKEVKYLKKAIQSDNLCIQLTGVHIGNLQQLSHICHQAGKTVIVNHELVDGLGKDRIAFQMLKKVQDMGIEIADVLLHVGLGTFRPVSAENVEEHHMHSEYYEMSEESAQRINRARQNGGRIIAVGTTSCRTLESVADENGVVHAKSGYTDIFITPGYRFKAVDGLITNFHLPESTLLMLVSALCSREEVMAIYAHAVEERYRFFSFGDCCLFL